MSPIGRVFIIVNLVLAAAFIGFASTFLQNHTNYKSMYDAEVSARADEVGQLQDDNGTLRDQNSTLDQRLTLIGDQLEQAKTQLAAAQADNQRLSAQLDTIEGNVNQITANTSATADTTQTLVQNAMDAYQQSLAAQQERDAAVQEKEGAVADLRDAQLQITQRQDQIDALNAQIATIQQEARQNEILLAGARQAGYVVTAVQPDLRGVVSVVGPNARLLTVSVTENPGEAPIEPGVSFAIYSDGTYKAEAVVTSVEGTFAFCRVDSVSGAPRISVGDSATTRTDFN